MAKPLTAISINNAKPRPVRYEIPDGKCKGLYLVVQPSGAKSWAFRYRFAGQPKKLTIGPLYLGGDEPERAELDQANTVIGARKLASEAAHQVALGGDPAQAKHQRRALARQAAENRLALDKDTVGAVVREFIEKHAKAKTKPRSWAESERILTDVARRWDGRTIHDITKRDIHDLLDSIMARGTPVLANRTLAYVRKMFNWALGRGIIESSPCAGIPKPAVEKSRERVLTDAELRLVWLAAERIGWPFGPVVQMLILTLQRRGEVARMHRRELHEGVWTIPSARAKNKNAHLVPLSAAARDLLARARTIGRAGYVFTMSGDAPVRGFNSAVVRLNAAVADIGGKPIPHWTIHDLRRTGATRMQGLKIQVHVVEKVLNHTSGTFGGITGVYQLHEYADEKREALERWAAHVLSLVEH
jgi:integrase